MIIIALVLVWIGCGIASYGFLVAYHQTEFASIAHKHKVSDRVSSGILSICGPAALLACLILGNYKHGWKL